LKSLELYSVASDVLRGVDPSETFRGDICQLFSVRKTLLLLALRSVLSQAANQDGAPCSSALLCENYRKSLRSLSDIKKFKDESKRKSAV
jgi:hypothetical protein